MSEGRVEESNRSGHVTLVSSGGGWRRGDGEESRLLDVAETDPTAESPQALNMNSVVKDGRFGFINEARRNQTMEATQNFPGHPPRIYEAAFRKAQQQGVVAVHSSSHQIPNPLTPVGNIIVPERERERARANTRLQHLDAGSSSAPLSIMMPRSSSPNSGVWCEHCNTRLIEMKRQALRLMSPKILNGTLPAKEHELSATLHEKLQVPDTSQKWTDNRCEVCATHLNQLKQEAVSMVHSLEKAQMNGDTASLNNIPALLGSRNLSALQRCLYMYHSHDKSSGVHVRPIRQTKGVYSNAISAMKIAAAHQYLDGDSHSGVPLPPPPVPIWNNNNPPTSALPPHYQASHNSAASSNKSSVVSDVSVSRPSPLYGPPALTNVSKSPPMISNAGTASNTSAAASFFARAAQKLNLTSKKKKKQINPPPEPPNPELPIFPTNFGDCLLRNPPSAPPCLLRSGRRENPGMGKVKVMLRICPSPHHYEGGSFLTLDPKKKKVPTATLR